MTTARRPMTRAVRSTLTAPRAATEASWQSQAACSTADADLHFPVGSGPSAEPAKAVCRRCPVMLTCQDWALSTGQTAGVWGGLTEDELKAARRHRNRSDVSVDVEVADRIAAAHGPNLLVWLLEEKAALNTIARRLGQRGRDGRLTGVPSLPVLRLAYRRLGVPMEALEHKPAVERVVDAWDLVQELRAKGTGQKQIAVRVGVGTDALREAIQLMEQRQLDEASDRTAVAS